MNASPHWAERTFPFLGWPRLWRQHGVRGDLVAGVTVTLVLVPQALAYAQLAGLPPHLGLYAALLPALVGALFGSCGALSTGPVALTSLLSGASLLSLAQPDTPEFIALAVVLALLSGLIQLVLGLLRAGWLLNLLSRPVMAGFINASALLIGLSQLPALLGLSLPRAEHFLVGLWHLFAGTDPFHLASVLYGGLALFALVALRRFVPRLPGVLLVVASATAVSALTGFAAQGGAVVGTVPSGLPSLGLPVIDWNMLVALFPAAFVIALVSFMEAASSATVITARTGMSWNQNQELIGQGLAKLAAAASGAMPVSASFSRSALNHASGARTGLSSLLTAAGVLLSLQYLTPLLWHLPIAVLAAVILLVVANLVDFHALTGAWKAGRDDGLAAVTTFCATLVFAPNIQNGILTGLMLSLALMLYRDMQPRVALLGMHPDGTYRDLKRFGLEHPHPNLVIMRFDSPLTFVTAKSFEEAAARAAQAQPEVEFLLISAAGINAIDATGQHAISALHERLRLKGQVLAFCGLKKQAVDALERTGLWARLSEHGQYRTEHHALDALLPRLSRPSG